jgi:hypothetical protein
MTALGLMRVSDIVLLQRLIRSFVEKGGNRSFKFGPIKIYQSPP